MHLVSAFQDFSFFCLIPWDLAFGFWNFAKVAAQPQTTKPDPFCRL
jgi:hypothetical protein